MYGAEEDAALYAEFIATKERLKRGRLILKINQVWSRVYPAYIYAIEERINVRAKGESHLSMKLCKKNNVNFP